MYAERFDKVRALLRDKDLDAFLFWDATDIRWCCGFSGSSGILLVDRTEATLLTDGRYRSQAKQEVREASVEIYRDSMLSHLSNMGWLADGLSLGLDGDATTLAFASRLEDEFPNLTLSSFPSPLKRLKACKSDTEIETMRKAQKVTDEVFEHLLGFVSPGMTEREVAAEIVYQHLKRGAERMSFEPIVASGPNGALPHARPSDRVLSRGDMVVMDFGCFVDGYASDMTRTIALGTVDSVAHKAYETVLLAQSEAQGQARSNMAASELDGIARRIIENAGFGASFTHSLGHGLGLDVHEWPRIAATSKDTLPDHAVVTIEPGVYLEGSFGIRIENSVVLNSDGAEQLPASDTSLIVI
jgi:Xaa-Pro aminopeptidase